MLEILFFLVFVGLFYLVDVIMVAIANTFQQGADPARSATVVNVVDLILLRFNNDATINFLLFFFTVQSAFFLGSVYFEKFSFIKTVITGFVVGFVLICFLYFFTTKLLPPGDFQDGFLTSYRVRVDGETSRLVQVPAWIGQVFQRLLMYGTAPFLWTVTYFRLKEKQV